MKNRILLRWTVGLLAALALGLPFCWRFVGPDPELWQPLAQALSFAPVSSPLPGLGRAVTRFIYASISIDSAIALEGWLARLLLVADVLLMFRTLLGAFRLLSGVGVRDRRRRNLSIILAAGVGALAFLLCEPIWRASSGLSGYALPLFIILLAWCALVVFLEKAIVSFAIMAYLLGGVVAAESPLGLLLALLAVTLTIVRLRYDERWQGFDGFSVLQRARWSMTFAFVFGFLITAVLLVMAYVRLGGDSGTAVSGYFSSYLRQLLSAADVSGWGAFILFAAAELALAFLLIYSATDEDRYLPFGNALVFAVIAGVAYAQVAQYARLWWWRFTDAEISPILVLAGAVASVLTFALASFVVFVETLCRDYQKIEGTLYGDDEHPQAVPETMGSVKLSSFRVAVATLPVLALVAVLCFRARSADRELSALHERYLAAVIEDCRGVSTICTDALADVPLQIAARRANSSLRPCLDSPDLRERLRRRRIQKVELAFSAGLPTLLAGYNLSNTVFATVVRPGGELAAAERSFADNRALADDFINIHNRGVFDRAKDRKLKRAILAAQFRLAAMLRLRSTALASTQPEQAARAKELALQLNAANPACRNLQRECLRLRADHAETLTPMEGLTVALQRADFTMARRYAVSVLAANANDPAANFAMGMDAYTSGDFPSAVRFLTLAAEAAPNEAAIHNNLALALFETDQLDAALIQAVKAQELANDSVAIEATVAKLEQAVKARENLPKTGVRQGAE